METEKTFIIILLVFSSHSLHMPRHVRLTTPTPASEYPFQVEDSPSHYLCDGRIDLKSYLFLNQLCEDCFTMFRDADVYYACR